jgi:hypothetical protein
MAMQCNFHRLQFIDFINNSSYTQAREIKLAPLLWLDSPDELGTPCPRDYYIESHSLPDAGLVHIATTQNRYSFSPHPHAARVINLLVPKKQNKSEREGGYLPPLQVCL